MIKLLVRHSAPRVLTLESARRVRLVSTVHNVVRHAPLAVLVDVKLISECAMLVASDITDLSVISSVKGAPTSVAIRMEPVTSALIQIYMD